MPPTEWAQKVLVRLTPEDAGILREVQRDHPGVDAASTFRAILRAALLPRDLLIRYRWPVGHPAHVVIPDWVVWGTMNPVEVVGRVDLMRHKGMEVEVVQVEAKVPRPVWPEEADDIDDDTEEEGE